MNVFKLLVYLSLCSGLSATLSDEIRMVIDVASSYLQPTAVVVNVCWIFAERYSLMSQLMKSKRTNTAQFVSDVKDIDKFEPISTLIVIDLNCDGSRSFLEQANKDDIFSKPYRWLMIGNVDEFSKSMELTALKILVNSEVMIAGKSDDNTFVLKLLYRIDMTSSYITEEIGIWSTVDGCQISEFVAQNSMVIRRKDLNGKVIAASYVITDNRTRTDIHILDSDLKTDNIAKITYHLIAPLYDFMNATKAPIFTNTWGYFVNNSWNGMVGDIDSGRAELCGTVSFVSSSRVGIIQYISQPVPTVPRFLFRDPPLSFQNNLFILPFRGAVWLCIGGLVAILIVVIYMNAKWENAIDEDAIMNSTILKPDVSDIGIFVISAITQQGSTNDLKGSLGRLVTFIMFLIFLFLYASYAANIVALLQSNSNKIRTLSDLLNSRLEIGVENETYNRYYFSRATEPVRKAIYENKVLKVGYKPNFMSLEEGVSKIRNKDTPFAFHMNLGIGYKIVEETFHEQEKCDLHEIAYYPNAKPWTCSRKASPFNEIYKVGINRFNEHGLNARFDRIFYVRKPVCNMRGGNFASVNLVDFHPVLLWMAYGMALSVILLMVEVLVHRRQGRLEEE